MVSLMAPVGCTSYSYKGADHEVPKDRIVNVSVDEALALRAHGFLPPAVAAVREDVATLTRDDLHDMLSGLGFAVADTALPATKMVEMLKAAVKAKAAAVEKAEADLRDGVDKAAADVKDDDKSSKKRS